MGDTGFETPLFSKRQTAVRSESGAKSDATEALSAILTVKDGTLQRMLAVWPMLSNAARQSLTDQAELLAID